MLDQLPCCFKCVVKLQVVARVTQKLRIIVIAHAGDDAVKFCFVDGALFGEKIYRAFTFCAILPGKCFNILFSEERIVGDPGVALAVAGVATNFLERVFPVALVALRLLLLRVFSAPLGRVHPVFLTFFGVGLSTHPTTPAG